MKKYRKYIIVFMLLFIYALVAETYSAYATEKNADYKYMNVKKGVTIKKYIGKSKNVIIPEKIDGKTVVGIEKKAFYENKKINMVKMPDTIKYIDYSAFSKCSNLKKVVLSKNLEEIGMYAFKKTAIVSVKIPDKVESLYYATFDKCKKLKSVKLGENVESIDTYCFRNCTNLKDICLENVKRIGSCAFANNKKIKGKLVLKDAVKIEDEAFYGCTSVTEVEFSPSLEVLGREDKREKYANPFAYCTGIEKFVIDNNNANYVSDDGVIYDKAKMWIVAYPAKKKSVADIEENIVGIAKHAFSGADITMLNMKNNLNFIGEEAFAKSDIEEVNMPFPDETKEIKWSGNAFESCKKLRRVIFPEGIKGSYNAAFINCTSLTEVILPESMTHISPEMFLCCESLETVTIPKDVSVIPAACFYGCKSLKNVNLDNIDDIHAIAFYDCDSFTGVLNLNVSKIEYAAFGNCDNITEINLNNKIVGLNVHNKFDFLKDGEFESNFIDSKIYNI